MERNKQIESLPDWLFYELPKEKIAYFPRERGVSKVLFINKSKKNFYESNLDNFINKLNKDYCVVFNDTKVIPARLIGRRATGGLSEIFLISKIKDNIWKALARPARKLKKGQIVFLDYWTAPIKIIDEVDEKTRIVEIDETLIKKYGKIPLPPYIKREVQQQDYKTYQTVFAKNEGSVAAPTAGLHFSKEQIETIQKKANIAFITLNVSWGTFSPLTVQQWNDGKLHTETFFISEENAKIINSSKKIIAVGTTVTRALESSAVLENDKYICKPGYYSTDIFIKPGYKFKIIDALFTNFHLPGSSLFALVAALAGIDLIRSAYNFAIEKDFKFFSYGDACFIY